MCGISYQSFFFPESVIFENLIGCPGFSFNKEGKFLIDCSFQRGDIVSFVILIMQWICCRRDNVAFISRIVILRTQIAGHIRSRFKIFKIN